MELILDTHTLIWFVNGDKQLPDKAVELIKDIENRCFVSIASIWEIAIKISLGRLNLNGGFDEISKIMKHNDIEILPLEFAHIHKLLSLDFHHRDPFDRIIIAQALIENLAVVSKDDDFHKYNIQLLWN